MLIKLTLTFYGSNWFLGWSKNLAPSFLLMKMITNQANHLPANTVFPFVLQKTCDLSSEVKSKRWLLIMLLICHGCGWSLVLILLDGMV
jgi:hypothetical protein